MQIIIDVIKQILRGILLAEKQKMRTFNVFFIVLDLRLTKVGVQRNSFFYALIFPPLKTLWRSY